MFSAEWFSAAAMDWLSSATSIMRVWIVGLSTEETNPVARTKKPSAKIHCAVSASSTSTIASPISDPIRVRFRSTSARCPPTRLPMVIPTPIRTSTIGTTHSGEPATSVTSGAT